jgi:hypothetical protein
MARQDSYEIKVQGQISPRWFPWFDEMAISTRREGESLIITTLRGPVVDQAALLGLLQRLYTLGLPLLLARRLDSPAARDPQTDQPGHLPHGG